MSLFSAGLRNTTLLQLVRLSTGLSQAFSVYAVYREDQMTFEVSARLAVARPNQSLQAILRGLVDDVEFLSSVLTPMQRQVDSHFATLRANLSPS